ncbi:MAG: response regulator [Deltaproteobacteria bacterium]|jgi:DNA-binding NtrC family response regulator|nr:response regulator [Deltaproteobacteria bacterium]
MSALILFHIENPIQRDKLVGFLEGDKYKAVLGDIPKVGDSSANIVEFIIQTKPHIVVMDYISEDALSVKIMQEVTDRLPDTGFIFVDSRGNADRENIMLAFNEGVGAFLPAEVLAISFLNIIARVLEGPMRFRHKNIEQGNAKEYQKIGEELAKLKVRLNSSQKLVNYLLATPANLQPRKVLILSDSGYQREMLKKLMEDVNFNVITASTVDEAVSQTLAEKPRVIISDYRLEEGKTGVDVCKEIKFTNNYASCFFVVCTAGEDMLNKIMDPGNGVDDCILKPSTDTSIAEFISRIALGLLL